MSSAEKRPAAATRTVLDPPHGLERTLPSTAPAAPAAPRKTNPPPPGLAASPDMGALLGALRRRWLLAISLGLTLAATVAAALWYFVPPRYTATAYVRAMMRPDHPWIKDDGARDFVAFLKTQANRIKSPSVLLEMLSNDEYKVRRLPLFTQMPDPHSRVTYLDETVKVDLTESSELLKIEFFADDPDVAVKVVDGIAKAYVKRAEAEEGKERKARTQQIEEFYNKARSKYDESYTKLVAAQKEFGNADPIDQAIEKSTRMQELAEARKQLVEAVAKLEGLKQQKQKLEKRLENIDALIPLADIDAAVADRQSVKDLEAKVEHQQLAIKTMVDDGYRAGELILVRYRRVLAENKSHERSLSGRRGQVNTRNLTRDFKPRM